MSSTSHGEPPSSTASTPASSSSRSRSQASNSQSTASYFSYPVSHVVSGLYRRLTDTDDPKPSRKSRNASSKPASATASSTVTSSNSPVFTPVRTASPFQPPPLTPITLSVDPGALQKQLLTRALAEEIRLLVPARLQLVDTWRLAYSLDRDGASLATLYEHCRELATRSPRAGYVLVVRDSSPAGAVFGAYMTDPPHPASHYFGTGECFLWRASVLPAPKPLQMQMQINQHINNNSNHTNGSDHHQPPPPPPPSQDMLELAGLPLPPSADTTHLGRSTTLRGERKRGQAKDTDNTDGNNNPGISSHPVPPNPSQTQTNGSSDLHAGPGAGTGGSLTPSGASTPERIRFKAFPYSGVNDYMMFCETGFLSLGGGCVFHSLPFLHFTLSTRIILRGKSINANKTNRDGRYGLWMDSSIEKGVSESCQTFGNEPLSDEGKKFDIIGVEVWYVGS